MGNILVFGDVQSGQLQTTTFELSSLANQLVHDGGVVNGAVLGNQLGNVIEAFSPKGMTSLYVTDHPDLADYNGDSFVAAAASIIGIVQPELVIFAQSADTSEWVPRLAAKLDAALVTGCTGIQRENGHLVAVKINCGGAFVARYQLNRKLSMITLSPGSQPAADTGAAVSVESVQFNPVLRRVEVLEVVTEDSGTGPALKSARVVVAGGIGVGSADNWHYIEDAATSLGAAVGASRAAVDMGWVPSTRQVGFSGLKVSADLYVAAGISGAIHHLAGLGRVKNIVAINEDAEASIFSIAKYGVVGDLKQVLPAFVARVNELKAK
jgi:electron transfer flavoprotein alpha subunit